MTEKLFFGCDDTVAADQLVPGVQVFRFTESVNPKDYDTATKPEAVDTPAPCCGRVFRNVVTRQDFAALAYCCACQTAYRLEMRDDNDGGWTAIFTIEEQGQVVVANHRQPPKGKYWWVKA
jgi:hypothetical protein